MSAPLVRLVIQRSQTLQDQDVGQHLLSQHGLTKSQALWSSMTPPAETDVRLSKSLS